MRLPNPDRAIVEEAKVRDYLLSAEHPVGQFKAVVFETAGYRRDVWDVLQAHLQAVALLDGARLKAATPYGQLFELRAILEGPLRNLSVITVWFVPKNEDVPRLVTVYPRGRKWRTKNTRR